MAAIGLATLVLTISGCSSRESADATTADTPALPVQVTTVTARADAGVVEIGGIVQPRAAALVTSRLMAPVREVRVAPGDRVRQGQVLVTLDDRDLQARVQQAASGATAAHEGRTAVDAERRAAAASLDLATASHGRIAALAARRSATAQELDEATATLRVAEARLAAIDARAREVDAVATSAAAGRAAAAVTAGFARVTAPFAGVVTEKLIEIGDMAMPGTPLVRLEGGGGYTLDVRFDAALIDGVEVGDRIDVEVDGARPLPLAGRVGEVARAALADARAFEVRIDLPADPALRAGMSGRARIPAADGGEALVVPRSAIARSGQVTSVFVVEGEVARRRLVVTGAAVAGDLVEIAAGLAAGERIVIAPPPALADGAPVRVGGQQ